MPWPDESYTREFLRQRTGRLSQAGGVTPFAHADGKAKGVSTLRIRTARGLEFWVVPDRGMDIFEATFQGTSLCWHSPTGMVHPAYYSTRGAEWLRSFPGGLLETCGLTTAGAASEDDGESLGVHGSISNTPAEAVSWSEHWKGDDCLLTVSGKLPEVSVLGPNLVLERTISTSLQSKSLSVHDVVENQGVRDSPLMVLYHFNFGFPLLTERSVIHAPSRAVEPADDWAARTKETWNRFEPPQKGIAERVYFHQMTPDPAGKVTVVLVSDGDRPVFGVALSYDSKTLPRFVQWKMTGANHFVLGLEPANCWTLGRKAERDRGTLQMLSPGDRREFRLELRVLNGAEEVSDAIRSQT